MNKQVTAPMLVALRAALEEGWVSAFAFRVTDDGPGFVIDHHNEDGDEQRTVLSVEAFDFQGDRPDALAHALNKHGKVLRVFGDEDDERGWGGLETLDADDD